MDQRTKSRDWSLPVDTAAAPAAPWATYPRASSGSRQGAGSGLHNKKRAPKYDDDMGGRGRPSEMLGDDGDRDGYGDDFYGDGGDEGGASGHAPAKSKPRGIVGIGRATPGIGRAERCERESALNNKERLNKASAMAASYGATSAQTNTLLAVDMQRRIDRLAESGCEACGVQSSVALSAGAFVVNVFTRVGSYPLTVTKRQCRSSLWRRCGESVCLHEWTPDAADAGCFAAQAGESRGGSYWFATDLLDHISELMFRGASFEAIAATHGAPAEQLLKAWLEHKRTAQQARSLSALGVEGIDTSPLAHCPVCADLDITLGGRPVAMTAEWAAQRRRLTLPLSVMMDASNTPDRKKGAGTETDSIGAVLSGHFSEAQQVQLEKDLAARRASGQNTTASDEGDGGCAPGEPPPPPPIILNYMASSLGRPSEPCAPLAPPSPPPSSGEHYRAGRRNPTSTSKKKSEGVCGACCAEGIPLRYSFFSMDDTHECFLFYDYIVDAIILRCDGVDFIFLDFGCKFGRHYTKREAAGINAAARARVTIAVPAMHAEGHVKPCRLRNCGIYIDGLGYIMGEEMEQLWTLAKVWAASTRCMTHANRLDFLNLAMDWVAKRKASKMYKYLTKKVRDMRAKETSFTATLRELENVRLAMGKEAHLAGARAWLAESCARLTLLETGGDGDADRVPDNFLPTYALNIVKESLMRDTVGSDAGLSHDFFFAAKGRGAQRTVKQIKELTASLVLTEATHDALLVSMQWLSPSGGRQGLATLLSLPSFRLQLDVAKRDEVSGLRTAIAVLVCELSALELLINQRGQRSAENAPNTKNGKERNAMLNRLTGHLHSLSKWDVWTVTETGVRLTADPAPPTPEMRDAARLEKLPWAREAGGVLDPFDGMRAMLDTYRAISAKLARVLKELVDLPIKFERAFFFYKNKKQRITECSDKKKVLLENIKADLVVIRGHGASLGEHAAACVDGKPCVLGCAVGEAMLTRGKKLIEARKLEGEIEMLRSHLEEAVRDAAPFDARADGAGWNLGPADSDDADSDVESEGLYGEEPQDEQEEEMMD